MISVLIKLKKNFNIDQNLVEKWAKDWLGKRKYTNCELSIVFLTADGMRRLNKKYRGVNKPTSVLSFTCGQATPRETLILGDLVVCPTQAKKDNLSLKFLVEHGLTNLLSEISTPKSF